MNPTCSTADAFCTSGTSPTVHRTGPPDGPAILVLGGISARHDLSWWPALTGPGTALDPGHHHLLSVDWLTGPDVSTHDQARAILGLLDDLDIDTLHAAVGCSYGGMVCLALAERAPERVEQLVIIGAAHRPHPLATAWRWVQREITRLDPARGLALARALAMTSYRSDRELDDRFRDDTRALASWLQHHGRVFTERFQPEDFLALSAAIDRHRVDPALIRCPVTLVGFDSDQLAPPWLLDELANGLDHCARIRLSSRFGHDAFLLETEALDAVLRAALPTVKEVAA